MQTTGVRLGGRSVVGFGVGDAANLTAFAAAGVALAALRADPNRCVTVAQTGTPTNQAVLAFKQAWNAQSGVTPVPAGPSFEPATASAIQQLLGADALVPACAPAPSASSSWSPVVWWGGGGLVVGGLATLLLMRAKS